MYDIFTTFLSPILALEILRGTSDVDYEMEEMKSEAAQSQAAGEVLFKLNDERKYDWLGIHDWLKNR